jgi:hypothetical protein
MPNDRILFFIVCPHKTMEECLKSDGSAAKVPADAVSLVRQHEKATFWGGLLFDDQLKNLITSAAAANPMLQNPAMRKEFDKSMEFIKQAKWGALTLTGDATKVKFRSAMACTSAAAATKATQASKEQWNKVKGMLTFITGMLKTKPGGAEIAKAIDEVNRTFAFGTEGEVAVSSFELNRATLDAAIAGIQRMGAGK